VSFRTALTGSRVIPLNTPDPVRAVLKDTCANRAAREVPFRTALTGSGVIPLNTPDPVRAVLKDTCANRAARVPFRTAPTGSGVIPLNTPDPVRGSASHLCDGLFRIGCFLMKNDAECYALCSHRPGCSVPLKENFSGCRN